MPLYQIKRNPEVQELAFSPQVHTQPLPRARRLDPETPLPPTLSLSETFVQQGEVSRSAVIHPTGGLQTVLVKSALETSTPPVVSPKVEIANAFQSGALVIEQDTFSGPLISIRLLKDVSLAIHLPGGVSAPVPLSLNAKRVQLLAYIAWRRGELLTVAR